MFWSPPQRRVRVFLRVFAFSFPSTCTADDGYGDRPTCARHPSYLPVLYVPADISEGVRGFASDIYLYTRGVVEHAEQALLRIVTSNPSDTRHEVACVDTQNSPTF